MRLAYVALFALTACSRPPAAMSGESAAFDRVANQAKFQPTAFSVEVHGHGRPVILIPGLGCPGSVWSDTVAHLRGYETHVLTLAGFAGKPRIDAPLAKTTVDELVRYIRDRGLDAPVLIGHSLGGSIAYWVAAEAPDLVGPTIVVDSGAPMGPGDREAAGSAAQTRELWRDASDQQFAKQVKDTFGSMAANRERLQPMIAEVAKSDRTAIGDAIYELQTTNLRERLTEIRAPVLLVLADGSLQDGFRRQAARIRNREVVVVPNTGHFVMVDDPDGFFAAVDGFLAKHELVAERTGASSSRGAAN